MVAKVCILITILVYLTGMIIIGVMFSRKNNNASEFYLGDRKLGPLVTAMSAEASDMSGWLLMGLPGLAYLYGIAEASWTAIGLAVGTYLNWLFVAKRIRTYSQRVGAITIPDFFSKRYHDNKNILNAVAAVIIIIFFIPYTASGFVACGKLFSTLFDINYMTAVVISAIVILVYCIIGGFLAVSTTDFVQSTVMSAALLIVVIFGISVSGGFGEVVDNAKSLSGYLDLTKVHNGDTTSSFGVIPIISTLAWGLGYFGVPHVLVRFMAIEDKKKLKLSRRVASIWVVISMSVAVFIGVVGYSVSKVGKIDVLDAATSENVIINIAKAISDYGWIFAIVGGIILAGILAASMSTADSQLLIAASSFSQNLLRDTLKLKISEKVSMFIARCSIVVISIIAVFLARDPNSSVFKIVSFAWAGFGATFGPIVLLALFWKRSNMWGALASMLSGGIMIFVWKFVVRPLGGAFDIYELLPAFIVAIVLNVVVSLFTEKPSKEIEDEFMEVKMEH